MAVPYAVMAMKMKMSDGITYLPICHAEAPPIVIFFEGSSECIDRITQALEKHAIE